MLKDRARNIRTAIPPKTARKLNRDEGYMFYLLLPAYFPKANILHRILGLVGVGYLEA